MNRDEIYKEADKIIDKHKSKSKPLLIRSLQLLEEMIDNHDAVIMSDTHYEEVKNKRYKKV